MRRKCSPYEARNAAERQRNLARLGTRWQERPVPPLSEEERLAKAIAKACNDAWGDGWWWGWFWGSWK